MLLIDYIIQIINYTIIRHNSNNQLFKSDKVCVWIDIFKINFEVILFGFECFIIKSN